MPLKTHLLEILADGEWKHPADLLEAGTSYTQAINKMRREQGYIIESAWVNKVGGSKKYRLVSTPSEQEEAQEPTPVTEARHEPENKPCVQSTIFSQSPNI